MLRKTMMLRMTMIQSWLPHVILTVDEVSGVAVLGQELLSSVLKFLASPDALEVM